jgi:RNA polymerase sigma factor (sigma-70 family)
VYKRAQVFGHDELAARFETTVGLENAVLNLSPDEIAMLGSWRSRAPDDPQLQAVLEKFRPLCLSIARRYLGDEAEDAVQEAFLNILQKIHMLKDPGKVEGWARTTITNTAINGWRDRERVNRVHQYPGEREDAIEQWLANMPPKYEDEVEKRLEIVHAAMERLTDSARQLLVLRFLEGLSGEETAQRLGITHNAVRSRLKRYLLTLRVRVTLRDAQGDTK